jgi:hypothetical protein
MCLTFENYLSIISLFFVLIGGCFALFQWRSSLKIKRAEFINQILDKLRFDMELTEIMYIVDYDQNWYNESFHNSEEEVTIDKLFSYLDYICYLKFTNNITKTEFRIFQYEIHRVCISPSSQRYLWNLFHFSKKNNTCCSFLYLLDYGINIGIIDGNLKTNRNLYNKKYLNF